MKPKHFVEKVDEARVVAAIATAERKSSGEIRIYVSHKRREDALGAAKARFSLGLHKAHHRKAVLIYFNPLTHKFAIWGDVNAHQKCGDTFWQKLAAEMAPLLTDGHLTEAIEHAVKEVGE